MMFRIWLVLFAVFTVYTCLVYRNCDNLPVNESAPTVQATAGWHTWQKNNCQSCHQIYGLGGYMGPDLTNEMSDTQKNENIVSTFMKYGTGKMPNFHLNDSEINNLIAFLYWIDKTGKSRVPAERVTWSGNYNLGK
jgi:nitric oxide reductase subunit C